MSLKNYQKSIYQVDAFTTEAFKGNPAGVVITDETMDTAFMQKFAAEMNLSETAFLSEGDGCFNIRYFTPYSEVPLCGHATLAAAHVLVEKKIVSKTDPVLFKTPRYNLSVEVKGSALLMSFPIYDLKPVELTKEFKEVTGLSPVELYKSEHGWILAYFNDKADIVRAYPHLQHMKHSDFGHLIITAKADKGDECDFIYRCFAPSLGIDEDPVTGSAQCALAPFWRIKTGKASFKSFQASHRTGKMDVTFTSDDVIQIRGNAITVFEGKLLI